MSETSIPNQSANRILTISAALVALEALALIGCTFWLIYEIVSGQSRSLEAAGMLTALVAVSAIWISMTAWNLRLGTRWARSSAVFWQTCQLAIAWGSFTGANASPAIGIALIIPSVLVLALLFTKPVLEQAKSQL